MMDMKHVATSALNNLVQTIVLLSVMTGVCAMAVYLVLGPDGMLIATLAAPLLLLTAGRAEPGRLLRARGARALPASSFVELHRINMQLARKAGLPRPPRLYWEPSRMMNGYATGRADNPAIVLSDTLLNNLSIRELAAILGHEMAHIANNDLRVMSLAAAVQRMTSIVSTMLQIMLLLALPLIITGQAEVAFLPVLFIIFAPTLSLALQLALSRTREFEADLVGVQLTGEPLGLIQALNTLESYHQRLLSRFFPAMWRVESSWLQTHPATKERIKRLAALSHLPWNRRPDRADRWPGHSFARQIHC